MALNVFGQIANFRTMTIDEAANSYTGINVEKVFIYQAERAVGMPNVHILPHFVKYLFSSFNYFYHRKTLSRVFWSFT